MFSGCSYSTVECGSRVSVLAFCSTKLRASTEYLESAVAAWGSSAGASTTMDPDHRLQPQRKHAVDQSKAFILTSVVCFTMGHYVVFTYFPKNESWMAFDDTTVTEVIFHCCSACVWFSLLGKVSLSATHYALCQLSQVGEWEACVQSMISKRLQPSLLFYCRSSEGNDIRLQNHKLVCGPLVHISASDDTFAEEKETGWSGTSSLHSRWRYSQHLW